MYEMFLGIALKNFGGNGVAKTVQWQGGSVFFPQ